MPKKLSPQAQTTPQHLASIVKSARDKMRKDKGLSGDTDRLPQLTWIMFLKFLDDAETLRQIESELAGQSFKPAIVAPYRWRDWAAPADGPTGDDLIRFISQDELEGPDGKKTPGLFAYLRGLRGVNGGDRRDVIANVFRGTLNRMVNGYILREVLTVINQINFASSDEIHTLSALYESMLKEMRDAAGDAGEFYTPRPVVRFMVEALDPQLGETILDPACGTGGFLVETYEHLHKQCASVEDLALLQRNSIFGIEAKPLPYLLCQMNLLLRGLEYPQIAYENSLAVKIGEIGDRERVDVILTNPPFGGEEESKIRSNFPADKQTNETALLFLQLIMRKLRRLNKPGRAAVILPNGTPLSGDGIPKNIRMELIQEFNLHTIVRLPPGTFSPYTNLETNILFFDTSKPTKTIWYYKLPLPDGRKNYTKTQPLKFEAFEECQQWWSNRKNTKNTWQISLQELQDDNFDLDRKNPSDPEETLQSPKGIQHTLEYVQAEIQTNITRTHEILNRFIEEKDANIINLDQVSSKWTLKSLVEANIKINCETRNPSLITPNEEFYYIDLATVNWGKINEPQKILGINAPSRARRVVHENDVIFSTVRPYLNGHAAIPKQLDNQICSTGFAVFTCPPDILPNFLLFMLMSPFVISQCKQMVRGGHYPALKDTKIQSIIIPHPILSEQERIVAHLSELQITLDLKEKTLLEATARLSKSMEATFPSLLAKAFQGDL